MRAQTPYYCCGYAPSPSRHGPLEPLRSLPFFTSPSQLQSFAATTFRQRRSRQKCSTPPKSRFCTCADDTNLDSHQNPPCVGYRVGFRFLYLWRFGSELEQALTLLPPATNQKRSLSDLFPLHLPTRKSRPRPSGKKNIVPLPRKILTPSSPQANSLSAAHENSSFCVIHDHKSNPPLPQATNDRPPSKGL
ncbi:unnamed protein product [Zymoseptoria tritici ST99CH_3D7]|uniref:Uncharacterized protein n=1 Tax=Zymoseptoria tritici (strain ST99CH_3D7) TaxID=1276538 RepID=A0A1X7RPF4_ZYMT9|nr:unnamed protein product [Zymoseptoria tritici ST99CH_3D7]